MAIAFGGSARLYALEEFTLKCIADAPMYGHPQERDLNWGANTRMRIKDYQGIVFLQFDFSSLRAEDIEADLFERDLCINSMAVPLTPEGTGDLLRLEGRFSRRVDPDVDLRLDGGPLGGRCRLQARLGLHGTIPFSATLDLEGLDVAAATRWAAWFVGEEVPAGGRLDVRAELDGALAEGTVPAIQGRLSLHQAWYGESAFFDAEIHGEVREGALQVFRASFSSGKDRVELAKARVIQGEQGFELAVEKLDGRVQGETLALEEPLHMRLLPDGNLEVPPVHLLVAGGEVFLEGRTGPMGTAQWRATVHDVEAAELHRFFPPGSSARAVDWKGLRLIVKGEGPLTAPRMRLEIAAERVQAPEGITADHLDLSARLVHSRLEVERCSFQLGEQGEVSLTARAVLSEEAPYGMPLSYEAKTDLRGIPFSLFHRLGAPLDGLAGALAAKAALSGDGKNTSATLEWKVRAEGYPKALLSVLPPTPGEGPPSWFSEGRCAWSAEGLRVESCTLGGPLGSCSITGSAPVLLAVGAGGVPRPSLEPERPVQARVELTGVALGPLFQEASLSGELSGTMELSGTVADPKAHFAFEVPEIGAPPLPVHRFVVNGLVSGGVLQVKELLLAREEVPVLKGTLSMGPAEAGRAALGLPGPKTPFQADLSVPDIDEPWDDLDFAMM